MAAISNPLLKKSPDIDKLQREWYSLFIGEVMTSFNHVVIPTRGIRFQTNSLEHEHDESGRCVGSACGLADSAGLINGRL